MVHGGRIPSLSLLCVQLLSDSPEQLFHFFGQFRLYHCQSYPTDPSQLDPRLWASWIQIYHNTSSTLITYPIQLLHVHLPLLQSIPQTPHFSLITLLELPGCAQVTDDFVHHLKCLHSLTAFDISGTIVSYNAIKRLAQTLVTDLKGPHTWHGPWTLRILRLHNCKNIDNLILPFIHKFPLLCVLDIRGTQCIPRPTSLSPEWGVSENRELFFPSNLSHAVDSLARSTPFNLWSSQSVFRLLINAIDRIPIKGDKQPVSFYGSSAKDKLYSAATYYMQKNDVRVLFPDGVSRLDISPKLMLYRTPPLWGVLAEAISEHTKRPARKRQEVVTIKGDESRRATLEKLQEEALCRRQSARSTEESVEQRRESRNPFRRRMS